MTDDEKLARCVILAREIEDHRKAMHDLAVERRQLIRELRLTLSLGKIAQQLGMSRGNVQNLERIWT